VRQVSFRSRLSVLVAAAVGVAVALAALVSYVAVSRQLEQQAKVNLENSFGLLAEVHIFPDPTAPNKYEVPQGELLYFQQRTGDTIQVITTTSFMDGETARVFPMTDGARQALQENANGAPVFEAVQGAGGASYLVASVPTPVPGLVVQVGYRLAGIDRSLDYLRWVLVLVAAGGVALATALGWLVGRTSMRPVEELTLAAEHVAETQDLSATIDDTGNDELGRLARSFNAMLGALAASRQQQSQLVSDAGHELRTPLTSLRTNIEVLMRMKDLSGADREELLSDVDAQLRELTNLVGDLVDLAREDERPEAEPEAVPFAELVQRAVERAQRRAMSVRFDVSLAPGRVRAQPALLERAVLNVLDNAAKWSPAGGTVTVTLTASDAWHLTVTDQGPGIAPQDLPHIFERFYRAPTARSMPGSGLGLAIVKRVISSHGGTVAISSPPAGGAKVDIELPLEQDSPDSPDSPDGPLSPDSPG
jgi:two-component system sensor histidine kinase MprB